MSAIQTDPQYKLRLPAELKGQIEAAAQANKRSMNAEIVARLQASFDPSAGPQDFAASILAVMRMANDQDIKLKLIVGEDPDEPSGD